MQAFWHEGAQKFRTWQEVVNPPAPGPSTPSNPINLGWVGHSLTCSPEQMDFMNWAVRRQGIANQESYIQVIPGAAAKWNWENQKTGPGELFSPAAIGNYDAIAVMENTGTIGYQTQEGTAATGNSVQYIPNFFDHAIANNPDTECYIYMIWMSMDTTETYHDGRNQQEQHAHVLPTWETIHDVIQARYPDRNIWMMPHALAWDRLKAVVDAGDFPGITNYTDFYLDNIHPNNLGRYFATMVSYACFYKRSPIGLTNYAERFGNPYTGMPTVDQAAMLQQIAWETVINYPRSGVVDNVGVMPLEEGAAYQRARAKINAPISPQYTATGNMQVGTNLAPMSYWEPPLWSDIRYQARGNGNDLDGWSYIGAVGAQTDSDGNLTALTSGTVERTVILDARQFYGGDYVLRWDQSASPGATVELTHSGGGTLTLVEDDAANGRRVYNIDFASPLPEESGALRIRITGPVVADIDYHILLPGQETEWLNGRRFNPHFVEDVRGYDILRTIKLANITSANVASLDDLKSNSSATWGGAGTVPYYMQVAAAQAAGADVWLAAPIQSTQAMMDQMAAEIRTQWLLGDPITVYAEVDNEIWNYSGDHFPATTYAVNQGYIEFPSAPNDAAAMSVFLADRSIKWKQTLQTAFGADASYIKLVVAGQKEQNFFDGGTGWYGHYSRWRNPENDIHLHMDVFSVTSYCRGLLQNTDFQNGNHPENSTPINLWTDQQFYDHLVNAWDTEHQPDILSCRASVETITGRTDFPTLCYEGGTHINVTDGNTANEDRVRAFIRSDKGGEFFEYQLAAMNAAGIDGHVSFVRHSNIGQGKTFGVANGFHDPMNPREQAERIWLGTL